MSDTAPKKDASERTPVSLNRDELLAILNLCSFAIYSLQASLMFDESTATANAETGGTLFRCALRALERLGEEPWGVLADALRAAAEENYDLSRGSMLTIKGGRLRKAKEVQ